MQELYGRRGLVRVCLFLLLQVLIFGSLLLLTVPWSGDSARPSQLHGDGATGVVVAVGLWSFLAWEMLLPAFFRLNLFLVTSIHRRWMAPLLLGCLAALAAARLAPVLFANPWLATHRSALVGWPLAAMCAASSITSLVALVRTTQLWSLTLSRRAERRRHWEQFKGQHQAEELDRLQLYIEGDENPGNVIRGTAFPGLTSKPWHERQDFAWVKTLEENLDVIRREALAVYGSRDGIKQYDYPGISSKLWQTYLLSSGSTFADNARQTCPETVRILGSLPVLLTREAMFSIAEPGAHIKAHRDSGNLALTCQLALAVPSRDCKIRVCAETRTWQQGQCMFFDTSYEHEVCNASNEPRIVLLFDFLHPDLSLVELDYFRTMPD